MATAFRCGLSRLSIGLPACPGRAAALDRGQAVAAEVDDEGSTRVAAVRPAGGLEGGSAIGGRIAHRHQHLISGHARSQRALLHQLHLSSRHLLQLQPGILGDEEPSEIVIERHCLRAVLVLESDRRMSRRLELYAARGHLLHLDASREGNEGALGRDGVGDLGLLRIVVQVATEVEDLPDTRIGDRSLRCAATCGEQHGERDDRKRARGATSHGKRLRKRYRWFKRTASPAPRRAETAVAPCSTARYLSVMVLSPMLIVLSPFREPHSASISTMSWLVMETLLDVR